jgi:RimJ/RimL family protein N-acetyltransferase
MNVPTIETARLRLRAHAARDFEACCEMWSDPDVTRFTGGKTSTPQQTWQRMLAYLGHWRVLEYGYWAIEERATSSYIGEAGFADFKRDVGPHMRDIPELGFALVSRVHRKGYASEAVRAILDWGDAHLPSKRTVALTNEENAPSVRVLEKHGYRVFDRTLYHDARVIFLQRSSD